MAKESKEIRKLQRRIEQLVKEWEIAVCAKEKALATLANYKNRWCKVCEYMDTSVQGGDLPCSGDSGRGGCGICRVNPPRVAGKGYCTGGWPVVYPFETCRDFQGKR